MNVYATIDLYLHDGKLYWRVSPMIGPPILTQSPVMAIQYCDEHDYWWSFLNGVEHPARELRQ